MLNSNSIVIAICAIILITDSLYARKNGSYPDYNLNYAKIQALYIGLKNLPNYCYLVAECTDNSSDCDYLYFNATTPEGKNMLSALLLAKAKGTTINLTLFYTVTSVQIMGTYNELKFIALQ